MFKNSHFGLNIGDQSLRFVKIIFTSSGIKVAKYGECDIPSGIIEFGEIKDPKKLEKILSNLKKRENLKSAHVSLPLSVLEKNMIEDYISVFKNSGISALSFEIEAQSLSRALFKKSDSDTYMIVNFGRQNTGIYIVSEGTVMAASDFNFGGDILSNLIQENLEITFEEAEKIKKKYGLEKNVENEKAFPVLLDAVSVLRDEVLKHFLYWHTRRDEDNKKHSSIKKIILCGGSANLIGLAE